MLLWTVGLGVHLLVKKRRKAWIALGLVSFFLFQSFQLFGLVFVAAVLLYMAADRVVQYLRDLNDEASMPMVRFFVLAGLLIGPWALFFAVGRHTPALTFDFVFAFRQFVDCFVEAQAFFPVFLLIGLLPLSLKDFGYGPAGITSGSFLVIALVPSTVFGGVVGGLDARYLLFALPPGALIAVRGMALLSKKSNWLLVGPILVAIALLMPQTLGKDFRMAPERVSVTGRNLVTLWNRWHHPPSPNPELAARDTVRTLAARVPLVVGFESDAARLMFYLDKHIRVMRCWQWRSRPDSAYLVILPDEAFLQETYCWRLLYEDCRSHLWTDRGFQNVNLPHFNKEIMAEELPGARLELWECPAFASESETGP